MITAVVFMLRKFSLEDHLDNAIKVIEVAHFYDIVRADNSIRRYLASHASTASRLWSN
jgi:hypothetical protein